MYTRAFVKSLILPSISVGVVRAEGKEDECDNTRKLVRPRDLALYVDPPKCVTCSNTVESEDGFLLTTIRCARQELQSVLEQAKIIQAEASSMLDNIKKETSDAVSYLQQEENLLPRMGAIGMGAFAGYILAVRKGILKKILYSAAGAGAIAAVAYPNEAREYSEEVLCELKKYAVIGYHFVNGADVDWKKLKEETRPPCFGKNGKSGKGSLEGASRNGGGSSGNPQAKSGLLKSNVLPGNTEENAPAQKPGGDGPSMDSISRLGNASTEKPDGDGPSMDSACGPQAGAQVQNSHPACFNNNETAGKRKSYRDQCKGSACVKRRKLDPNALPKNCSCTPMPSKIRSKLNSTRSARSVGDDNLLGPNDAHSGGARSASNESKEPSCTTRRPYSPSGPSGCGIKRD